LTLVFGGFRLACAWAAGERKEEKTLALENGSILVEYFFNLERFLSHFDKGHVRASPLLETEVHDSCGVEL
jgi:hypothetical protein